ncbi:hypothetical protein CONPUDRAFT_152290 [Coniophora puteana RWD-64-598 SS2]|uniref:F-box domain-containing protein n=1 Tax=Coniophora puteana (strain RWD-64-598) TaxID=741705 RepID=A0A5M3MWY2_CONPW|nr:uncharacterized protein CONPUDRAFT_152290 [Coniophora puteana RWD-64-598 SS2]EIW83264.1 hypothetical protein CONPUDRAFT_152290 [Coniophora puteana RWD-64-598 SS2]
MSLTLETLSLDVLISIAIFLDPPDVIHLRLTSKKLCDLSYERVVWIKLYNAYRHLTRPVGPSPAQTRDVLEKILVTSYMTHQNLFVTPKEPLSRLYDTGDQIFHEVIGRWALARTLRDGTRVLCYDLDFPDHEPREPTIAWLNDEGDFHIWDMRYHDVTLCNRRKIGLVLLELRTKDLAQEEFFDNPSPQGHGDTDPNAFFAAKVIILKVISTDTSSDVLVLEELYRFKHALDSSDPGLRASLSPSALIIQWAGDPKQAFVWDTEKLSEDPVAVTHRHATSEQYVLHTCSTTHVISRRSSLDILGTVLEATPLQSVISTTMLRPTAVVNMPGVIFFRLSILRDSVVDPITGYTEVVLIGTEQPGLRNNGNQCLSLVRLLIPPAPEGSGRPANIDMKLQELTDIPLTSFTAQPSATWNGCVRVASLRVIYDREARGYGTSLPIDRDQEQKELYIMEVTYDEKIQSATIRIAENVSLPADVHDIFNRQGSRLESFEAELGSGRLVYRCDLGIYESPQRKLGVLDFA